MASYIVYFNTAHERVGVELRAWGFDDAMKQAREDFPGLRIAEIFEKRDK